MKILKTEQYINEKLTIQPVTKDRLSDYKKPSVDEETIRFIKDNNLIWNPLSKSYDCEGDVIIPEDMVTDGKLKIRFGKVGGNFDCSYNELTTLEGAPKNVGGNFYCGHNNMTTLVGAPQEVDGGFNCINNKLTTLEGAPSVVGRGFYCSYNNLTSLEGAPNEVSGGFYCNNNKLTALKGAPKKVGGDFDCSGNPNLVLPKDKPSWLKGKLIS
jgi:hypothetical protein